MNKKYWIPAWIALYALSVVMGALWPQTALSTIVGVLFFLPPTMLLWIANQKDDKKLKKSVRLLSAASLVLTTVVYVVLFLSLGSEKDINALIQALLVLVAAPNVCFKAMVVSIFGWACLFYGSFVKKK